MVGFLAGLGWFAPPLVIVGIVGAVRFGSRRRNGAWLAVQVIAHNLTRSARRVTLHLPARWPWAVGFSVVLARLAASR